jgi:hypothetical protein
LVVLGVVLVAACGGDDDAVPIAEFDASSGGGRSNECIDEDGDGFGEGRCRYGRDCDDEDPDVGDECIRCPRCDDCLAEGNTDCEGCQGCPCEEGAASRACRLEKTIVDEATGTSCSEGVMNCRDGEWTRCETADDWLGI